MHKLVIQDDEGKTTVVPLIRDEITVGRKEGNTIRLTERNVSRKHARILRKTSNVTIEDLNSYNGVRVNGTRIQGRINLNVSDRIQIGDYLIELKADTAVDTIPVGDDQMKTQPIDRMNPLDSSAGIPIPQDSSSDAETIKMPGMLPAGLMSSPGPAMEPMPAVAVMSSPSLPLVSDPASEAPHSRLVVLSTSYAGREFMLSKPAMVLGRTDDNDMVVNHRSISRHHAKVVRENGRHAIVDLQSSNGVRVNGEEYGKVELRRGDIIDLGHVRLRFVEAGEDFVFARDAQVEATGGGRGLFFGLVAAVVIAGVVGAFAITRGGGGSSTSTADSGHDSVVVPKETIISIDAAPAAPVTPSSEKIRPYLDQALIAVKQEMWPEAIAAVDEALTISPDDHDAQQLLTKAKREQDNKARFDKFKEAVRSKNPTKVAETFGAIDEDSVYRDRARDDYDRVGTEYTSQVVVEAKRLARLKKCRDIASLAGKAAAIWPDAEEEILKVEDECKRAVAAVAGSAVKRSTGSQTPTGSQTTSNGSSQSKGDDDNTAKPSASFDELITEVKEAFRRNQYGVALKRCREANKLRPRDLEAITLCGFAACNLKDEVRAKRFYNLLPPSRKSAIYQTCLKMEVDLHQ